MQYIIRIFCTLVLSLSSIQLSMAVEVIGLEIEGLHQKDGNGIYDKILENYSEIELTIVPPARAYQEFDNCADCCFSPGNKNPEFYEYTGDNYLESLPMDVAAVYIFSKSGVITSLDSLSGKRVGGRFGMEYGKTFNTSGIELERTRTIESNIKKLERGRIDAFIAFTPDAYTAFENLDMTPYAHDKENPVATHNDALLCKNNSVTEEFVNNFNLGTNELIADEGSDQDSSLINN